MINLLAAPTYTGLTVLNVVEQSRTGHHGQQSRTDRRRTAGHSDIRQPRVTDTPGWPRSVTFWSIVDQNWLTTRAELTSSAQPGPTRGSRQLPLVDCLDPTPLGYTWCAVRTYRCSVKQCTGSVHELIVGQESKESASLAGASSQLRACSGVTSAVQRTGSDGGVPSRIWGCTAATGDRRGTGTPPPPGTPPATRHPSSIRAFRAQIQCSPA